jgi:hypothetical protein
MEKRKMRIRKRTSSLVLLGGLGLTGMTGGHTADAGRIVPPGVSTLRLAVDKPIIHLGERAQVSGYHFTPGAEVAISLHGPMSATLGRVYARVQVARDGDFSVPIAIPSYPDAAARQWHTVVVAVVSSALLHGVQEGAAVAIQADPMPGLDIVTKAGLARTSLVIDGTEVPAVVTARDAGHYRISYAGHLRVGMHGAYLKWSDAVGGWGARAWSFHIGSPYAVSVAPSLNLSAYRIHLGEELGVAGNNFTPGAVVTISLGGPNAPPGTPVAKALVDATGEFRLLIRIARYPATAARAAGAISIEVTARGSMVGDLPEGVAVQVRVAG